VSFGEGGKENAGHWDDILCVHFRTGVYGVYLCVCLYINMCVCMCTGCGKKK